MTPTRRRIAWALAWALSGCGTATQAPPIDTSPVPARIAPAHLPPHWQHGVFMEIFVRAYQDSDGDGIGDLRGLTSRLDHLKDLGIRGIWLMPITANADRDHGYATTDFRAIDRDYGTMADLDELLRQAHARGIGVIMDYVINHAAASHPMFEQARQGPDAPFRDWFVWSEERPRGWFIWDKDPWYHTASRPWLFDGPASALPAPPAGARGFYFGTFGAHMPDFNFRNPAVTAYHHDSLRFWLNRGLDGFRLDAVPHLVENGAEGWNDQPESRALVREIAQLVHRYPHRYLVCEATARPESWGGTDACGGAFAFGHVQHIVKAAMGEPDSVAALARYFTQQSWRMATFVSNHDGFAGQRLWDQVKGDETRYRLAAAGYLLQPGTPFIYFGEEVGQAGITGTSRDNALRAPMSWTAEPLRAGFTRGQPFRPIAPNAASHNVERQRQDPGSLLNFYKALIGLRNERPSIARGSFEHARADGLMLRFERRLEEERSLVLINYGTSAAEVELAEVTPGAALRVLHGQGLQTLPPRAGDGAAGAPRVRVPARSVHVLDIGG